ncbi:hypothetical protein BVC80_8751g23 [Macleaya cordata]|uniref:Leucine-rich repeat n=1 Tax=Macleaya cordata TaxID=56857 RepID=A0A200QKJ7_MACCD|nr:hypothetical protein BVC80_8751g23 [Macleaya cordata]
MPFDAVTLGSNEGLHLNVGQEDPVIGGDLGSSARSSTCKTGPNFALLEGSNEGLHLNVGQEDPVIGGDLSGQLHISSLVICDHHSSSPRIVELDLSKLYLDSFEDLAPVFNIKSLIKLDLSKNFLQGDVPVSMISNLSLLVYLDLSYNNLSGQVPSHLFSLIRNLQHLDLSGNSFSAGELSCEVLMSNLSDLKFLNLAGISVNKLHHFSD